MKKEIWKKIDFTDCYLVSNLARVKSLARFVKCGPNDGGFRQVRESFLSSYICKQTGYPQVNIHRKKFNVHRLVAKAFLGDPFVGAQVNHKNGDRADSRLQNIEW